MRTTLTVDEDVMRLLKKEMRLSGISLKTAVNHFLRLGLLSSKHPKRKPFVVKARKLGLPPGLSYDNAGQLIEDLEGATHK